MSIREGNVFYHIVKVFFPQLDAKITLNSTGHNNYFVLDSCGPDCEVLAQFEHRPKVWRHLEYKYGKKIIYYLFVDDCCMLYKFHSDVLTFSDQGFATSTTGNKCVIQRRLGSVQW